jgi:glucan phosphoethanolaminetransferase (alkaline phosphatase superfamily)
MTAFSDWENFYVIVGSSAGALIGLQFVVITLIADLPISYGSAQAGSAFATPTIVHFCAVLLLAAILSAPWRGIVAATLLLGLMALSGLIYTAVVTRRMWAQTAYKPEFEDWMFHALLPLLAYAILGVSAYASLTHVHEALFGVAVSAMMLLFVGIHNAWDAVTYHVFVQRRKLQEKAKG